MLTYMFLFVFFTSLFLLFFYIFDRKKADYYEIKNKQLEEEIKKAVKNFKKY